MNTKEICKADLDNLRNAPMYASRLDAIDYVEARLDRSVSLIEGTLRGYTNVTDRALMTIRDTLTEDEQQQYIVVAIRETVNVVLGNGPRILKGESWDDFAWLDNEFEDIVRLRLNVVTDRMMLQFLADRSTDGDADYILS